jgi:PAS domain S-box-containing protein
MKMSEKPTYEELEQRVRELEQGDSKRKQIELELHRRAEELAVLNALARRVSATLSLEKTCDAAVKGAHEAVNPTMAFIFLREGDALILKGIAPQRVNKRLGRPFEHRVGECICGLAVRHGQAMFSCDIHTDKRCTWKECKEAGFRSLAALPLRNGDDVIGVMGLAADVERDFETQSGFLEMIASQVSMAFHNIHLYDQVQRELAQHKQTEEALRQSEAKFRELADMLPQIVFETDVKGNLSFVNQNAFDTFGYTKDDFASGLNAMQMIAPKDRDRAADRIRQKMSGQSNLIGSEFTAVKKDGTEFPIIIYSNSFLRDGRTAGLRGIMIDITERKRAEEEREKLRTQLIQAQKMESIGTLAGGIAHNFNNILMGVQGRTSLMLMGKDRSDRDYEHLKGIEEYLKNAVELTKDLLGFARGGKYELKPTDLNRLIKNENKMFGHTRKEIQIHSKYENDLWTVEVDQSQIQQALLNLYVNAWQATPGGGDLYIQTENVTLNDEYTKPFAVTPGRYVKISVTDTGVGMDAATRDKIFDPFFSTKDIGQGSGLGLASVYGIIKNHGGFIKVYSEAGKGATFNIYLPASEKKVVKESPDRHKIHHGQGTVLLVDDEKTIIDVGQAMLKELGYRVLTAGSGQEALDLYAKQRKEIGLVILDMIMPGMSGGETYDRLKEVAGDVKVILSSGYSLNGEAREILDRGCSGFIQKPFALEELSRKVAKVLDEGNSNVQQ